MYPLEQLEAFRFCLVDLCPFAPAAERLVFPDHEGSEIDYCRLNYLLVHKDAPSNSINCIWFNVCHNVTKHVCGLVADHFVFLQEVYKQVK
jgi:hypothetical protein